MESQPTSPTSRGRSPGKNVRIGRSPVGSESPERNKSMSPNRDRTRSKSPSKFGESDFERKKVSADSAKRRQSAMAKVRGLKLDPSQWTRQELIDKLNGFAHFSVDEKSGIATLSSEGRRLLNEDVQVLLEIMRRVTEIQTVNLSGCGLTDDVFKQLLDPGLVGLRHLRELRVQSNLLTSASVDAIVHSFSKISRKLVLLDMQFNSLVFEDGKNLFSHFASSINDLNGFPMGSIMQDASVLEVLDVSNRGLRLAELGIVCGLMEQLKKLNTINIASNRINALGLSLFVQALRNVKHVVNIDISHNPVTDEERDFIGVGALLAFAKTSTQLQSVKCEGILKESSKEESALTHSLMANRSVLGHSDGSHFNKFAMALIERTARPSRRSQLAQWQGQVNQLDLDFIKNNSVPHRSVEVVHADQSLSGRDEIIIRSVISPSANILEF